MKLIKYLKEEDSFVEEIIDELKTFVSHSFLKAVLKEDKFLYRGRTTSFAGPIDRFKVRDDRKPKDSKQYIHDFMDKYFYNKFGWKARSEGAFAVSKITTAQNYGNVYLFFPIGDYKFIWSPVVYDLFNDEDLKAYIDLESGKSRPEEDESAEYSREQGIRSLTSYTDRDLDDAIVSEHEIMFKCKEYFLVKIIFIQQIREELKKRLL